MAPLKHRRADQFREVPVPEFLYQRIMEHAERWSIPEDGFLCPGRSAPYVHRPSFYEDFRDGVGPRNCRTNSLSIGCGTTSRRGVSVGMPLPQVSRILGHASTATTERVYWHMLRGSVSAARRVLDEGYRKLGYTPGVSVSAM